MRAPILGLASPSFFFLGLTFALGCGSEFVDNTSSGSGGGGSTSSSNGTGQSSSTSTGGGGCPATLPQAGTPCDLPDHELCSYGECCPSQAQCFNGVWQVAIADCGPVCPFDVPAEGDPCSQCEGPCGWEAPCPEGGFANISATCTLEGWHVEGSSCPVVVPCGGDDLFCFGGEICVTTAGGPGFSYACVPNPCGDQALSCECAGGVCGGEPFVCTSAMENQLFCDCPQCA
jgi:hypothetical protein